MLHINLAVPIYKRWKLRFGFWVGLATLLAFTTIAETRPSAVVHNCRLIPDSLKIDGMLDEAAWKQLDTLTLLRNNDPAGGKPSVVTKVMVGWNQSYLYTAFIAETRNVKGTMTKHDGPLYNEDVVEMFLDPDGDSKNYVELEWNCLGTTLDMTYSGVLTGPDLDWSPKGAQMAVKVQGTANKSSDVDTAWVVEIALPWSILQPFSKLTMPPKNGDALALNFYRIDHPSSGGQELIAWSPTGVANFHRPDKFGSLVFSDLAITSIAILGTEHHQASRVSTQREIRFGSWWYKRYGAIFNFLGHKLPTLDK